jgi:hypothetical protein
VQQPAEAEVGDVLDAEPAVALAACTCRLQVRPARPLRRLRGWQPVQPCGCLVVWLATTGLYYRPVVAKCAWRGGAPESLTARAPQGQVTSTAQAAAAAPGAAPRLALLRVVVAGGPELALGGRMLAAARRLAVPAEVPPGLGRIVAS